MNPFSSRQDDWAYNSNLDGFGRLAGDYYADEENVTRGVTFHPDFAEIGGGSPFTFGSMEHKTQDYTNSEDPFSLVEAISPPPPPPLLLHIRSDDYSKTSSIPHITIHESDLAQVSTPSQVAFGGRAFTSVTLGDASHVDALRAICNFFQSEMPGSMISKFSSNKCSIKADIFLEEELCGASCSVKARLFYESKHLVAEFQRRGGDSVAFSNVFKRAQEYLRKHITGEVQADMQDLSLMIPACGQLLLAQDDKEHFAEDLRPLVDTVRAANSSEMQAEALAALLVLTNATAVAVVIKVCQGELRDMLVELAMSPVWSIAQPASRLASLQPGA
jgi:hypothetical protein